MGTEGAGGVEGGWKAREDGTEEGTGGKRAPRRLSASSVPTGSINNSAQSARLISAGSGPTE